MSVSSLIVSPSGAFLTASRKVLLTNWRRCHCILLLSIVFTISAHGGFLYPQNIVFAEK